MSKRKNDGELDNSKISETDDQGHSESEMETANGSDSDTAEDDFSDKMAASIALSIEKVLSKKLDSRLAKLEGMIYGNIDKQNEKIEKLSESHSNLQSQYSKLLRDYDNLYKEVHKKNIILRGVEDEDVDNDVLTNKIEKLLSDVTKTSIKTDEVYRIGKYLPDKCRVVSATLLSMRDKQNIVQKKDNFQKMIPPVGISSDFPKSMRIAHALLFHKRKELQDSGSDGVICFKTYSIRASNGDLFNVVDGKLQNVDHKKDDSSKTIQQIPESSKTFSTNKPDGRKPKKVKLGEGPSGSEKGKSNYDFRTRTNRNSGNNFKPPGNSSA